MVGSRTGKFSLGFSLIEILVVLAGATILLAVAVPSVGKLYQEWVLWGAAHTVESSLRWGRAQAVTANSSVMFVVEGDGRVFYWLDPESGDTFESTVRYLPEQVRIVSVPKKALRFSPRGNATPAGTYLLQGEAGFCRVVVNVVGRIRVQRD